MSIINTNSELYSHLHNVVFTNEILRFRTDILTTSTTEQIPLWLWMINWLLPPTVLFFPPKIIFPWLRLQKCYQGPTNEGKNKRMDEGDQEWAPWRDEHSSLPTVTNLLCFYVSRHSLILHSADEVELRCGFFSPHCEDGAWLCFYCHMLRFEAAVTVLSSPPHQATVTNAISPQETICPWKHSQTGVAYAPSTITWSFLFSASNKASTRSSKNHT